MLWSLDMDDFIGLCHDERYPLLSAVTEYLEKENDAKLIKKSKAKNEHYGK